ncbi:MAG: TonB family protein [Bdellovibrionales bacterium]|nr:TonB family protein [Bdellovibrionales bacterium]
MLKKLKYSAALFLILSLFVHFSAYLSLMIFSSVDLSKKPETVEIEFVDPEKLVQQQKQQIVQQEKQINDEIPTDSKYLSQHNQVVKKETRAEKTGEFKNSAKPGQAVAGQQQVPQQQPQKMAKKGPSKIKKLSDLIPQYSVTPDARQDLSQHVGDPSQTDDYLKDVEKGLETMLSTREFLYYSYYNRIKSKIRQYWEPNVRESVKIIYRKGRSIASAKDRVTQVLITLDGAGELKRIDVITQSGIKPIDDAAVKAFKQAAPFPNPPKGMVEKDGMIRIRWDFILEARSLPPDTDERYAKAP